MVIAFRESLRSSYKGVDRKSDRRTVCALLSVVALRTVCTHSSALRRPRWARVGRGSQRRERPVRHDVWYGTTHTYRLLSC